MTSPTREAVARPDGVGALLRRRARALRWSAVLVVLLAASVVVAVGTGPVPVPGHEVLEVLLAALSGREPVGVGTAEAAIVRDVRAPRVLLGAVVGGGLAVCGAVLQAMVRNLLADPYVLGISGGASTGAAAALLFGFGSAWGAGALPVSAFLGACAASALVFLVARSAGRLTSVRLLLAGVAVGYALSAATSFMIVASDSAEGSRSVMFWLLGSLGLARWDAVLGAAVAGVVLALVVLLVLAPRLDALASGDDTALSLGVAPERTRLLLLALVSLTTGVLVAAAGAIGFVGLVVPHLARRLVGSVHRQVLPVAALLGAVLLVWADVLARTAMAPRELPIGIITALAGAPFLLLLVRRMHAQHS
ncbi:FecCD family ABC transporter permease [Cellulomonas triticagri]|uniref:Iron ABC transporter permease n=1 Tax=Cellulomonas triticagri TaxID=2483352 RepID=A0A3M2J7A8_9CELL|nr:iron ABC transporter permease [Cellulomonas triticagri]RMI09329.1 iron ABC transporter permease [Cellulomonas triticagri]